MGGVAGTIPVLAQRAASEGPRWTRAVGIIPPTPLSGSSLRPCLWNGASWRAGVGRVRSLAFLSILRKCSPVELHVGTIEVLACRNSFSAAC
jgi:hypothetical protein